MTDRHAGYIVTLERDIREDDAQDTVTALRMVKGVIGVDPVIGNPDIQIAEMRATTKFRGSLIDLYTTLGET